ncbi:hypothetical protein B0A52_09329 [Exophiala mesophila]|uniref:Histone deacetylase complex subunit SAP30 Sin3 binding domain-containing protein n=1 Tax=Exophiala mesophila TaxID=212818 RepID=A0A438MU79_EXOME|nr:hypothetical protein B0A52_09329 [Exophiala mesophila]
MPPAQRKTVDDSRSEASSIIPTNQRDLKNTSAPTAASTVSKSKRPAANSASVTSQKGPLATGPNTTSAASTSTQSSQTSDDWTSAPNTFLRTYRIAHRLPVASTFAHPHADIIYKSSHLALRSPSAVQARRKQHEQKRQKRKSATVQVNGSAGLKSTKTKSGQRTDKMSLKDSTLDDVSSSTTNPVVARSIETPDATGRSESNPSHLPSSPNSVSTLYSAPREPAAHLAAAVRKHFNGQQISEAETIARFTYVVTQAGRPVWVEGCEGDGSGHWMGSHGRELRKGGGPGGDVGFRLRFRP